MECTIQPAVLQCAADFLAERGDVFRVQDEIIQCLSESHCAGVHDGEAHYDKQVLGEEVWFVVAVVVGEVEHPLQEVVRFFVRGIRQFCLPAALDHWDEKLFLGVLHLLLESPDAWEKLGDKGTDEVGEWP